MKKFIALGALIALLAVVVAVPALAAVHNHNANNNNNSDPAAQQAIGQESQTGNVSVNFSATQSGNNSNQCVTPLQFGNTGSLQNAQGVLQYGSNSGDIQQEGSTFTFNPTLNATCNQAVQQSAAASG